SADSREPGGGVRQLLPDHPRGGRLEGHYGSRSGYLAGRRGLHGGGQLHVRWRGHRTGRAQDDGDRQQDQRRRDGGERQRRRQRRARREHLTAILFLRPYFRAVGGGLPQAGQGARLGRRVLTTRRADAPTRKIGRAHV